MLWHFPALQVFARTPLLWRPQAASSHTWRREQQRFLPNFQVILPCASGNPRLGGGSRRPRQRSPSTRRGAPGASTFCVRGAASSHCLQGAGGGCYWVEVCATSLVRQSKSLERLSAALGRAAGRGSPHVRWGWHCTLALPFMLFWVNS